MYPSKYLYDPGHEWLWVQGDFCVIGITDFAQSEMQEIVHVNLPAVGTILQARDVIGNVESLKAIADIYTPIAGEVVEVNPELETWPAYLNEDPHGKGWMIRLRYESADAFRDLMTLEQYEQHIQRPTES